MVNQYANILKVVETTFLTAWGSTTPVIIGDEAGPSNGEFTRISVVFNGAQSHSIGENPIAEISGGIFIGIFVPVIGGTRRAAVLADIAVPIFNDTVLQDDTEQVYLYLGAAGMYSVGVNGGYIQRNVSTVFTGRRPKV